MTFFTLIISSVKRVRVHFFILAILVLAPPLVKTLISLSEGGTLISPLMKKIEGFYGINIFHGSSDSANSSNQYGEGSYWEEKQITILQHQQLNPSPKRSFLKSYSRLTSAMTYAVMKQTFQWIILLWILTILQLEGGRSNYFNRSDLIDESNFNKFGISCS